MVYDNFEFQSVYFAYQFPVRTITLGEGVFDTTLDNEHKCRIMATLGGVYSNAKDVSVDVEVANPLTTGLLFKVACAPTPVLILIPKPPPSERDM